MKIKDWIRQENISKELGVSKFVNLLTFSDNYIHSCYLEPKSSMAVTPIDLKERFRLMCFAFDEQEYEVDDNMVIIEQEKAKSDDKMHAFLDELNSDE